MAKIYVSFDERVKWFRFTKDLLQNSNVTHILAEREKLSVTYRTKD